MIAIELEAPIKGHRLEVSSHVLPEHVLKARVIVMYEEPTAVVPVILEQEIDAILASSRGILGNLSIDQIDVELAGMRKEWDRDWDKAGL